jgi:hypothetical protein
MSAAPEPSAVAVAAQRRPIREIVAYFLRLGTLGFGAPVALCALMEKELVGGRGWLTKGRHSGDEAGFRARGLHHLANR